MADKIRILIETMMPDLLALNRKNVFSKKQIKDILHTREELEYGLAKKNVTLKEYYKAIEYEYSLEKQRRQAFESLKITKHNYRDYSIIRRITQLYDRVTHKYKYNINLWKEYLGFCYTIRSKKLFFKAITHALSFNSHNLDLWLLSVYYEFDVNKSPFKARKIFFKALEINPKDKNYWSEYFRFEIKFAEMLLKRKKILESGSKTAPQETEKMVEETAENPDFIPFGDAKDDKFINSEKEMKLTRDFIESNRNNLEVIKAVYDTAKEGISSRKEAALEYLRILEEYFKEGDWLLEVRAHIMEDIKDEIPKDAELNLAVFKTNPKLPYFTGSDREAECKEIKIYVSLFLKKHLRVHASPEMKIQLLTKFLEYITEELSIKTAKLSEYEVENKKLAFSKLFNVCNSFLSKQTADHVSESFIKNFAALFKKLGFVEPHFRENLLSFCDLKFKENADLYIQIASLLELDLGANTQEGIAIIKKKFAKDAYHFNKENRLGVLKLISALVGREKKEEARASFLKELFQLGLETLLLHKKEFWEFFDNLYDSHFKNAETLSPRYSLFEEFLQKLVSLNQSCPPRAYLLYINLLKEKKTGAASKIQAIFKKLVVWFPKEKSVWLEYIRWETERENGRICSELYKNARINFPHDPEFSEEYWDMVMK